MTISGNPEMGLPLKASIVDSAKHRQSVHSPSMMISKQTLQYKSTPECELYADVYTNNSATQVPVLLWIHGGALIMGHREQDIRIDQMERFIQSGYALVSIDYRLAPEAKLDAILSDVCDSYQFIRTELARHVPIDPDRIGVIGHSAGGYLALMTGFTVKPLPRAIISYYGYGDIAGSWYSQPDPFYRQQPHVSEAEAYSSVGEKVLTGVPAPHNRHRFYLYCRQQGLWPREVTGFDPEKEPEEFHRFCPIRNASPEFPPTFLLHGDADTDVPYQQSLLMAEALETAGVKHHLYTIVGGAHSFDKLNGGLHDPKNAEAFRHVLGFLEETMGTRS